MNIENLTAVFEKNNIQLLVFNEIDDAVEYVRSKLDSRETFCSGGSMTLKEIGLEEKLLNDGHVKVDAAISDVYFSGANAVTEDGLIVNVDRSANRVSSIAYGPHKVYIFVGKNKVVKNLQEATLRIKTIAAPLNAKRLCANTPCAQLGHCVNVSSNMHDGCASAERLCCQYLITSYQKIKERISIILTMQDLGY